MNMTGEVVIAAPQEAVYAALNDVEILQQAIPGCEEVVKTSATEMTAKVTVKIGPVKAKFSGEVTLSDLNPPTGYTISGSGKGGAAGHASGSAKVNLAAREGGTLRYEVAARVGGKMAQLGGRLIDSTAKKLADQFFSTFQQLVTVERPPQAALTGACLAGGAQAPSGAPELAISAGTTLEGIIPEDATRKDTTSRQEAPEKKDRTLIYLALAGLIAVIILAATL